MATTPRTIRFDDDLYQSMKDIAKRPLTASYHIQEACREYLARINEDSAHACAAIINNSASTGMRISAGEMSERHERAEKAAQAEVDKTKRIILLNQCFYTFWSSGIRKVNKKKSKSIFIKLAGKEEYPEHFTLSLCEDIRIRLNSNQLGFDQMHPTTYLNNERWTDEVISHENNQRPNQAGRPSLIDRVNANCAQQGVRSIDPPNQHALAQNGSNVRSQVHIPVRRDAGSDMGDVFEGDYRETDG